jgi:hypothetical protein
MLEGNGKMELVPLLFLMPLSAIVSRKIGEMIHEMDRCPADFHGFEKVIIENKSFPGRVFFDIAVEGSPQDRSRFYPCYYIVSQHFSRVIYPFKQKDGNVKSELFMNCVVSPDPEFADGRRIRGHDPNSPEFGIVSPSS